MWGTIAVLAISAVLSVILAPKRKKQNNQPITDFEVPTVNEGQPIPVLFGTKKITGSNVLWYGDIKVVPIKQSSGKKG